MRWHVSLTAPEVRDNTRTWSDVVGAVSAALWVGAILEAPNLTRNAQGGLQLDAALEAPDAIVAYARATSAASLACRGGGVAVPAWSTVLVVSRPSAAGHCLGADPTALPGSG